MKKIKVEVWKEKLPLFEDPNNPEKPTGVKESDWSILKSLDILIANRDPQTISKGIDQFRFMSRLGKAFSKAEKDGVLELEDSDYAQLKKLVESNIPDVWGMNPKIMENIETFLNASDE